MRTTLGQLTLVAAAGAMAAAIGLAPQVPAQAEPNDCREAGTASVCQRPGHSPMSPGAPDPATQQLLGGGMPNPVPPLAAFG